MNTQMATAVQGQISAYHDAVMNASKTAVACWDMHKPVQEAILITPGIVKAIASVLANAKSEDAATRSEYLNAVRNMLRSMNHLLRKAKILQDHDFALNGIPEVHEAVTQLRFLIADIIDGPEQEQNEAIPAGCESLDSFKAMVEESHPPQSWYNEDVSALRGPRPK
jgi:hypothetical protein